MSTRDNASELRAMAYRLLEIADRIEDPGVMLRGGPREQLSARQLRTEAARLYALRRKRRTLFDGDLFGEPAWDILLDMFIHAVDEKDLLVTSVCMAASVPSTTALRYIRLLECKGMVSRQRDRHDRRVHHLTMTDAAYRRMGELLTSSIEARTRSMPKSFTLPGGSHGKSEHQRSRIVG